MATMQKGNPVELQLLAAWPVANAPLLEMELHGYLWRYHVRGEWFKLPYEVIEGLLGI